MTSLLGNFVALASTSPQTVSDTYLPDEGFAPFRVKPTLAIVQPDNQQRFFLEADESEVIWRVNGIAGGDETVGTIDTDGVYAAPMEISTPQVLTVTAETSDRTAGASLDVLGKNTLFNSQRIVQSVAYLGSLERLYTAELSFLSTEVRAATAFGSEPVEKPDKKRTSQTGITSSEIFESTADFSKISVANFNNERISKMIPFQASNGREFLLLAGQTTGRIIRLDPLTREMRDVVTGLNEPSALVMDSVTGKLLVAERDRITTVPRLQLESDLLSAIQMARSTDSSRDLVMTLTNAAGASGVAVDDCTGNIYFSDGVDGSIYQYERSTDLVRTVAAELKSPGQLLAMYRNGIPCPYSFQLLVSERGSDRLAVVVPRDDFVATWFDASGNTDLAFLTSGNSFASASEAVVLTETNQPEQILQTRDSGSSIVIVKVSHLYEEEPDNVAAVQDRDKEGTDEGSGNEPGGDTPEVNNEGEGKDDDGDDGDNEDDGDDEDDDRPGKRGKSGKSDKDDEYQQDYLGTNGESDEDNDDDRPGKRGKSGKSDKDDEDDDD